MNSILQQQRDYSAIVAMNPDGIIGMTAPTGEQIIPWDVPEDMTFFRSATKDAIVIMGRKTFETLPILLKDRVHIVISRNPEEYRENKYASNGNSEVVFTSLEQVHLCVNMYPQTKPVFVIGGSEIYRHFIPNNCSKIYITIIHKQFEVEEQNFIKPVYFGLSIEEILRSYDLVDFSEVKTSSKNGLKYEFWKLQKKQ